MEPNLDDLAVLPKAQAILSAIAVVLYSLWVTHFEQSLAEIKQRTSDLPVSYGVGRVRLVSLCVILFQFALFISSPELRHAFPLLSQLTFCVGVVTQLSIQSRVEKKLSGTGSKTQDLVGTIARGLLSWMIGALFYILSVYICLRLASLLVEKLTLSPNLGVALYFICGLMGTVSGLMLNFITAPLFLKKVLPNSLNQDEGLVGDLRRCFGNANLPSPELRIVHLSHGLLSSSLMAGYQFGRGPFRPILFVAEPIFNSLDSKELETLILSHISHIKLNHFRKKFILSFSLIVLVTFTAVFSLTLTKHFGEERPWLEFLGIVITLSSFFLSFRTLLSQVKKHQFEADVYVIERLGAPLGTFSNCLKKLDISQSPDHSPRQDTLDRIQNLESYLKSS